MRVGGAVLGEEQLTTAPLDSQWKTETRADNILCVAVKEVRGKGDFEKNKQNTAHSSDSSGELRNKVGLVTSSHVRLF